MKELIAQAEVLEQFAAQIDVDPNVVTPRMLSIAMKQTARTYRMNAQAEQPAEPIRVVDGSKPYYVDMPDGVRRKYLPGAVEQPAEPQGEPVAEVVWHDPRLEVLPDREPHKIIDASLAFFDSAPIGTKLYRRPDPRVSMLEGLLRECLTSIDRVNDWELQERIEAALEAEWKEK